MSRQMSGSLSSCSSLKSALAIRDTRSSETNTAANHDNNNNLSISSQSVRSEQQHADDMSMQNVTNLRQLTSHLHQTSDEEDPSRIFLSVVWAEGRLAAAYYDTETTTLHIMNDVIEEAHEFAFTKKVLQVVNATCILTSAKSDGRFLKVLRELGSSDIDNNTSTLDGLQLLPAIDFGLEQSRQRIMCLNILKMPKMLPEEEFEMYLSSIFSFDSEILVRAVGGLLKYLDQKRIGVELEDPSIQVPVAEICPFTLADILTMDDNAFKSLHIFRDEHHPSVYKYGSGMKEGLSLFGIYNQCVTALGAKELRLMFLMPSTNSKILNHRQQTVAFFVAPHNLDVITSLRPHLKRIKNVPAILARMQSGHRKVEDWFALHKTVQNGIQIAEICRGQMQAIDIFNKISQTLIGNLIYLSSLIDSIMDFEATSEENRFVVKSGVDAELDEIKRTYYGLPDFMTQVASQELQKLPRDIDECEVFYLPQVGFLVSLPVTDAMQQTSDYTMPGLILIFVSGKRAYYKSEGVKELDNLFGDIWHIITDYETTIMLRLQETVMEHSGVLIDTVKYAAQLDCFISIAMVAKEFNFVRPQLTDESMVQVNGGRHPLQEMCVSNFVPNDVNNGGPSTKIKIITGLNGSGKSVYLKQVALTVYMARIGSFVPAKSAVVGYFDRIFTRIQNQECVSVGMSAFMIDLNQLALAVQRATAKSLVVIDEFGKGTNSLDGVSLLASVIKYWQRQGPNTPHIFLSTHMYPALNAISNTDNITFLKTDTVQDGEEMVCLYRMKEGKCENSCAYQVALKVQLPSDVVKRSLQIMKCVRENTPIPPKAGTSEITATRYISIAERFLQLDLSNKESVNQFLSSIRGHSNN